MSPHLSICIVSSDQATITVLRFMFMAMGFASPLCFNDTQEAWGYIGANTPDLILDDCRDDPVSARQLMERVRANQKTASVPIIALTASKSETCWREALKAGATEFLFNPFNIKHLHGAVETALFSQKVKNGMRDSTGRLRIPA